MLKTRVIPCLLLHHKGLVKTFKFKNPTYIGDPINAVRIFNDKEVDELIFLDIDATTNKHSPDFNLLEKITSECFMPFAYGGGVNSVDIIKQLLKIGVEKIVISSMAVIQPEIVKKSASIFGSQAIIVCMDIKKDFWGKYKVFIGNGITNTGKDPLSFVKEMEKSGCGELLVNNIDRDGTMEGYDLKILKDITKRVIIPVIACGGAGKLSDFHDAIAESNVSAVAAGSMFVYHGKTRGILINYPQQKELSKYI